MSRRLDALRELIAMARGERADPDVRPTDPPPFCQVALGADDDCDQPATRWIWVEEMGGWIAACDTHSYQCDSCAGTFLIPPDWDAEAEAAAAFAPDELADRAVVCDDCWLAMRAAIPELDERYERADVEPSPPPDGRKRPREAGAEPMPRASARRPETGDR